MKVATTIGELYSYGLSAADTLRCYQGTGFRNFDYSFYNVHGSSDSPYMQEDDRAWKSEVEDVLAAADECGFKFVQAHAPGYNPGRDSSNYDKCIRAMQRSIEACAMLGIPVTVMHTSFSQEYRYPDDRNGYFEYNKKFVGDILDVAEKYGITLCIENTSSGNMGVCYFPRRAAEMNTAGTGCRSNAAACFSVCAAGAIRFP